MKRIHHTVKVNGHISAEELESLREEIAQEKHELESEIMERDEERADYGKEAGAWEEEEDESISY